MVPQRIPYVNVSQYARDFGLADTFEDLEEFITVMSQMDDVWIKHATPSETRKK